MSQTHKVERSTPWTEERVAYAVKMWRDGNSATDISRALAKSFGVKLTRNSVIGKLHRMGVMQKRPNRVTETQRQTMKARKIMGEKKEAIVYRPKPLPPQKPLREPDIPTPFARPWQQRTLGQCTWPLTVDGAVYSCCGPIEKGSFCGPHSAIGYDTGVRKLDVNRSAQHLTRWDRVEVGV